MIGYRPMSGVGIAVWKSLGGVSEKAIWVWMRHSGVLLGRR